VLDVIEAEDLCARATKIGKRMRNRFDELARRNSFSCIGDVRNLGAMVAVEFVKDRDSRKPDAEVVSALIANAQEKGLILLSCGVDANIVRLLAPLTIPMGQVDEGLDIFEAALTEVVGKRQ
jgi:4-aminobutyrate aminotransferase